MERVCFTVRINPSLLDEYRRRHAAVWTDLLEEIEKAGRRNCSIFLGDDGLLVGYYEIDDEAAGARALAEGPVSARWEKYMQELFVDASGRIDQTAAQLPGVFNLDEQLASARAER